MAAYELGLEDRHLRRQGRASWPVRGRGTAGRRSLRARPVAPATSRRPITSHCPPPGGRRARRFGVPPPPDAACCRPRRAARATRMASGSSGGTAPTRIERARRGDQPEARVRRAGRRWSRRPASPGRRSSLRELHDRQPATTLSQVGCRPATAAPRGRCSRPCGCSTGTGGRRGEDRAARQRDPVAVRHAHEVHEPDHRRHGKGGALGVELGAVARDDLGLLLEHEDDRPADRHDAERLEAGVEQQRSSPSVETSYSRPSPGGGSLPARGSSGERRHRTAPLEVRRRGRGARARRPVLRLEAEAEVVGVGTGRNGGRRHHRGRASLTAWRNAVGQSDGRREHEHDSRRAVQDGAAAPTCSDPWCNRLPPGRRPCHRR